MGKLQTPPMTSGAGIPRPAAFSGMPSLVSDQHDGVAFAVRGKRYPPIRIALAIRILMGDGLDATGLLKETDLSLALLDDPETRVSSLQLLTVLRNAIHMGCAQDVGLRIGQQLHTSCYGMLGYAVMCSATMQHAIETMVRYNRLGNSMFDAQWQHDDEVFSWLFPAMSELPLPELTPALYNVVRDISITSFSTLAKDIMGTVCMPLRLKLTGPATAHADAIARTLGCPLEFDSPVNGLEYSASWLSCSPQLANPITAAQVSTTCERMLEEFHWESGMSRRVYLEMTSRPGRFPEFESIAAALCMTSRTLRRKLEAEGTSFSELLDKVRQSLAMDYLQGTQLSMDDISAALGFGNTVSFRRAFKRWTGKSPSTLRR